jgi:hypothetical protein
MTFGTPWEPIIFGNFDGTQFGTSLRNLCFLGHVSDIHPRSLGMSRILRNILRNMLGHAGMPLGRLWDTLRSTSVRWSAVPINLSHSPRSRCPTSRGPAHSVGLPRILT